MPLRYPGFEIDEDLHHERREWRVQRIAWSVLYLLLGAIALGLFGQGPLSKAVIGTDDAPVLEYERFMRHRSPDTLRVTVVPSGGKATVAFGRHYLQRIAIAQVEPQPERVVAGADATQFIFSTASTQAVDIQFDIRPDRVGSADGWIAVNGGERRHFSQFVYP